ncbi:hypothetical protein ACFFQF_05935 [Haladaptatus pallidirubidus]|nr:hypothetical protein [Haladaptatus pallidirubidus]
MVAEIAATPSIICLTVDEFVSARALTLLVPYRTEDTVNYPALLARG